MTKSILTRKWATRFAILAAALGIAATLPPVASAQEEEQDQALLRVTVLPGSEQPVVAEIPAANLRALVDRFYPPNPCRELPVDVPPSPCRELDRAFNRLLNLFPPSPCRGVRLAPVEVPGVLTVEVCPATEAPR